MWATRAAEQFEIHLTNELQDVVVAPALLRQLHGDVAGAFGNAEINAVDQRNGNGPNDLEQRVPFAGLALESDGCFRNHMALDDDVMGSGTAHAQSFPDGINAQVRRVHRDAEVQDHGFGTGFLQDGGGHEDAAGGRTRGEHLARGDFVATLDALGLASSRYPIGAAAG